MKTTDPTTTQQDTGTDFPDFGHTEQDFGKPKTQMLQLHRKNLADKAALLQ